MKIVECEQGSAEWHAIRRGRPTSSCFDKIVQPIKGGASASQDGFIDELIAELLDQEYSQQPENRYISQSMQQGTDYESAARNWYAFQYDVDVRQVGICLSDCGRYGASPDGMIGENGLIEVKCPELRSHIRYLREGKEPAEYRCQIHGLLAVTGREFLDFISYSPVPELENFVIRITPDAFTEKLRTEVESFCDKLDAAMAKFNIVRKLYQPKASDDENLSAS
jgi:hypothetical protein